MSGKTTPRGSGKWKSRFGLGRRKSGASEPQESDHGQGRSLASVRNQKSKKGAVRKLKVINPTFPKDPNRLDTPDSSPSNPQSPYSVDSFASGESDLEEKKNDFSEDWEDDMDDERRAREMIYHKQRLKERDGFCRRVDTYDGNVIVVDQKPTYEIGNYLGGGVAGVVYQGHRLRPMEEYPVRTGDLEEDEEFAKDAADMAAVEGGGFFCAPVDLTDDAHEPNYCGSGNVAHEERSLTSPPQADARKRSGALIEEDADVAIEATMTSDEQNVMLDAPDAPSRSKHFARAASIQVDTKVGRRAPSKSKNINHGLTDEKVAVKILNPVGFRILQTDGLKGSVVVKEGEPMSVDVKKGQRPMQEKHVWWLVNPNSRNLRTLQRYNGKEANRGAKSVHVDRGSKNKGLRLSLVAAYIDPRNNKLRELTLTRCIEIWGHVPFNASDVEFEDMMAAIERVNAGHPPLAIPAFGNGDGGAPGRVGTDVTGTNSTSSHGDELSPVDLNVTRTGLLRAALSPRATIYCEELNAYIAIPAVPSKYLRWLRQRRAATKEVRNMMLIGRHKNVLHLFEVLEYIQDAKSTMFLILELVKGGELFDLISSSNKKKVASDAAQTELMMRKFFAELSSGIHFCHKNGIAHRDLKPENLLVHNGPDGQATLKIADFGLSATLGNNSRTLMSDNDTLIDSLASPMTQNSTEGGDSAFTPGEGGISPSSKASVESMKDSVDKFLASGASALSFLTCGAMEGILCIPSGNAVVGPMELRRMTSVVGSPHYVAPEIISQTDESKRVTQSKASVRRGYDGAKADVWSAGVILYAMLFRSLPFGEDLLRCPRFQSYRKWYEEARELGGRRSSADAALNPYISDADERDLLGPHWFFPSATSKESRDLIVAMLNTRPEHRLSIAQVLEHPWVMAAKKSAL